MTERGDSVKLTEIGPETGLECVKTPKECSESRVKTIICTDEHPDSAIAYEPVEPIKEGGGGKIRSLGEYIVPTIPNKMIQGSL